MVIKQCEKCFTTEDIKTGNKCRRCTERIPLYWAEKFRQIFMDDLDFEDMLKEYMDFCDKEEIALYHRLHGKRQDGKA